MGEVVRLMTNLTLADYTHMSFDGSLADRIAGYFADKGFDLDNGSHGKRSLESRNPGSEKLVSGTLVSDKGKRVDYKVVLDFFKYARGDNRNVYVKFSGMDDVEISDLVNDLGLIENVHYPWQSPENAAILPYQAGNSR